MSQTQKDTLIKKSILAIPQKEATVKNILKILDML